MTSKRRQRNRISREAWCAARMDREDLRPARSARVKGTFGAAGPVRVITDEERQAVEDRLRREGVIGQGA